MALLPPLPLLHQPPDVTTAQARDWLATHGARIVVIVVGATVAQIIVRRAVPPAVRRTVLRNAPNTDAVELEKRAHTLADVFMRLTALLLFVIALLMALNELGYSLAPVIAGVSITGVAIGLGAQSLVKDSINGVLILAENQFRQGDHVTVANVSGTVEEISLRRTLLRDIDGTTHSVPNSAIIVASNHTRDYSGVNFAVLVPYNADLKTALALAGEVGEALATDPATAADVLEAPRPLRIENVDAAGVTVRILGRARPGRQAHIASEYRRRLKEAFDAADIRYTTAPP